MDLLGELLRLEQIAIDHGVPTASFSPPADDAALDRLIDAVSPMVIPAEVLTLYRWHDGCELQWLDSLGLQSIGELLAERDFQIDEIGDAPAWLILSRRPGGSGVRVVITLEVPGAPRVEGLWSVETHDQFASRTYNSVAAAARAMAAVIVASGDQRDLTGRRVLRHEEAPEEDLRLVHNPGAFHWPDPPAGTQVGRFPDDSWPQAWTMSLNYR